jgi:uncharacterized damage-inducible protein DinB
MKEHLVSYTNYNVWANGRICEVLASLTNEQLDTEIVSSFSSLRKTVYHVWGAEEIWKRRITRAPVETWTSKDFHGTIGDAIASWKEISEWFAEYAASSSENSMNEILDYKNIAGMPFSSSPRDILHHVMNHSTFHRGQLVTLLRQVGVVTLPSTDYIAYTRI